MNVNEYFLSSPSEARQKAEKIQQIADDIYRIFSDVENAANSLFGENWTGSGSETARTTYDDVARNYEPFYQELCDKMAQIKNAADVYENADAEAGSGVSQVG